MEALVLAARDSADLHLDAILRALQASPRPIGIIDQLPTVVTRKRLTDEALAKWLQPDNHPAVQPLERAALDASAASPAAMTLSIDQDPSVYLKKLAKKSKKIRSLTDQVAALKQNLAEATQRVKHMELEQEQFFEDVQEMKTQFDRLSDAHRKVLWEYLPAHDAAAHAIPLLSEHTEETPTRVGRYPLEQVLGYGQYAVVYSSFLADESQPLAVKAIDKNKVVDLLSLHRVNSEIASLSDPAIHHPCILALKDVIHTSKHVYLVTERGGKDLFEYFGAHQLGLDEDAIKPLMLRVAQAVRVLHSHGYCHRDLKPENILYSPSDTSASNRAGSTHTEISRAPHLIKLIDFGLCTKVATPEHRDLRDFCGSPGFFAPEMLLAESYDGFKADVWSVGCILLELVLGNAVFSAEWMSIYDLPVLKDHERFAECIRTGLARTRERCHSSKWTYSSKLRHLLLSMLSESPSERLSVHQVLEHPWFTTDAALMATYGEPHPSARSLGTPAPGTPHPSALHPHLQHLHYPQHASDALSPEQSPRDDCSSPLLGRRISPSKVKALSTSSAPAVNALRRASDSISSFSAGPFESSSELLRASTPPSHPSSVRPLSPSSSALAVALAIAEEEDESRPLPPSSSPGKVSLPSLSPDKPGGQRSPDKAFAKRAAASEPKF